MAKSKVDFQQLLLQHGEHIGIGLAGGLAVLLVGMSLFWPKSGVFSGSPSEKAKTLADKTAWVNSRLNDANNLPGESDKPPPDADKKRVALDQKVVTPDGLEMKALVIADDDGQLGRRQPKVYPVDEAVAAFAHMQI